MKICLLVFFVGVQTVCNACPLCNSDTAARIRASLFGPDLFFNLLITCLPFVICSLIVYFIYHGGFPVTFKTSKKYNNE